MIGAGTPPLRHDIAAPSHQAMEQAAQWYALLRSGEASARDRQRWQAWLDAAGEHRQAWGFVERVGRRFEPVQGSPDREAAASALRQARQDPTRRRRQLVLGGLGALGLGSLAWTGWRHTPLPTLAANWSADHRAGLGQTRHITLPDGTQVWLRALGAFDADYSATQRLLRLRAGEMLIETASDPARAFFVDTGQGRMQALGTRFTVKQEPRHTLLTVYDGAVRVDPAQSRHGGVLTAGQQARFDAHQLAPATPADPAREAWRRGILIADGITLAEVVHELRAYHAGHIALAPEVAGLPVFGSYPAEDPVRTLRMLASVMPLRISQPLSWWIGVGPRG